mmetsp:Transcript_6497/g.16898  ORF Transcript_6497/g.16898 Transcript_6497/m.16898 type:complete len:100 (-) Transcript_6497:93-392(-)
MTRPDLAFLSLDAPSEISDPGACPPPRTMHLNAEVIQSMRSRPISPSETGYGVSTPSGRAKKGTAAGPSEIAGWTKKLGALIPRTPRAKTPRTPRKAGK